MDTQKQVHSQLLGSPEDLELLVRGDVVEIIYELAPSRSDGQVVEARVGQWEHQGAYHGRSPTDQIQFLIPVRDEYILRYQTRRDQIQVKDGKVVLNENRCATKDFYPEDSEYTELNDTLIRAGLR